jgi:FKBP-type peptidyl-prolyl cis-trans isomerase
MREGGRRRITVPAALGYGAAGRGDFIPPHAKLVYELELLAVR